MGSLVCVIGFMCVPPFHAFIVSAPHCAVHAEKAETGSKYAKRKIGKFNNFYKEMGIVAHMQEMQPYFDKYQEKVRKAKNASGMTLAELSQCSGVPYNSICSVNAGTTKQPLLF